MNNYIDKNPWAGLSSYEDPEKAKREGRKPKLFCGRDDESHNVAQLISGNIFVTLYGKSGTGKTSLLNAGVFPRLRQKRYLPISIRLSMDALGISFQQCIIKQLTQTLEIADGQMQTINVVPLSLDEQAPDYLWSFFARTRFTDNEGRTLFPVMVLDQFEEVFRDRRNDAEALLCQIAYLMDESHALTPRLVDGISYKYDFNFRFVASIREDDLYRLEDSIDNNYLSELKRCRYRLRSLSEQSAREAILIPGEGLFRSEEEEHIVQTIISIARNKDDHSISTNLLSLVCNRIFVDSQRNGSSYITQPIVDTFVNSNPFERFYNEATRGFSNREKSYIEEHLVDSTGRRNSMPESDFLLHVKNGVKLLEGDARILQRTSTSSDSGNYRIELIHDSFCEPLAGLKEKRRRIRRMKWAAFFSTIGLLCIGIVGFILYMTFKIQSQEGTIAQKEGTIVRQDEDIRNKNIELEAKNSQLLRQQDSLANTLHSLTEKKEELETSNLLLAARERELRLKNDELSRREAALKITNAELFEQKKALGIANKNLEEALGKNEEYENAARRYSVSYTVDDIEYSTVFLTDAILYEWKNANSDICREKVKKEIGSYKIPEDMISEEPCLAYLILHSSSLSEQDKQQYWFNLWYKMNERQKERLYNILYREIYQLAAIDASDNNYNDIEDGNRKAYAYAEEGDYQNAIEQINSTIKRAGLQYANVLDSKGELLLMSSDKNVKEAYNLWKEILRVAPDFLDYHKETELYRRLREAGKLKGK